MNNVSNQSDKTYESASLQTVDSSMLTAQSQLAKNLSDTSTYSLKAISATYSKSKNLLNKGGVVGEFFDHGREKAIGKSFECVVLSLKYLIKVSEGSNFIASVMALPNESWTENNKLNDFRAMYSDKEKYTTEEGKDLLLFLPEINDFRHLFCKGIMGDSVPGIINQSISGKEYNLLRITGLYKEKNVREWFNLIAEVIEVNEYEFPVSLPKVIKRFLSEFKSDEENSPPPTQQKKKGR